MKDVQTVKVVVNMPKPIHRLITKLAAVEGSKPDEWYVDAIIRDVNALLDSAHDTFDVKRVIESNGLQELIHVP
jgi:hypothetical protein